MMKSEDAEKMVLNKQEFVIPEISKIRIINDATKDILLEDTCRLCELKTTISTNEIKGGEGSLIKA